MNVLLIWSSTRAATGSVYPGPGLYAKFYDQNFEPMVEVIQDTCGRHDNFGSACTSKYYEDEGFLVMLIVSDNFSGALARYGIGKRKSWAAMNLFFNTFLMLITNCYLMTLGHGLVILSSLEH